MLKIAFLLCFYLFTFNLGFADLRDKQKATGDSRSEALKKAYWRLFDKGLKLDMGYLRADENDPVMACHKKEFQFNFDAFKAHYFRDEVERCKEIGQTNQRQYKCSVLATVDLDQIIRSSCKKRQSQLGTHDIVILHGQSALQKRFARALQSSLQKSRHTTRIFDKRSQMGLDAKQCIAENKKFLARFKRMGLTQDDNYQDALAKYQSKIARCKQYKTVEYAVRIDKVHFKADQFNSQFDKMSGTLGYAITLLNAQTGEQENSIKDAGITASGYSTSPLVAKTQLENKLFNKATFYIVKQMNEVFMEKNSLAGDTDHYIVKIIGRPPYKITRQIRNLIKTTFHLAKRPKNKSKKTAEKIYLMPKNQEIDIEDIVDLLHDKLDQYDLKIESTATTITLIF